MYAQFLLFLINLFVRKFLHKFTGHPALTGPTTTRYCSRKLYQFSTTGHNSVATLLIICDVCSLVDLSAHERIFQGKVEGILKFFIAWLYKVVKTLRILRCLELLIANVADLLSNFVETHKTGSAKTIFT